MKYAKISIVSLVLMFSLASSCKINDAQTVIYKSSSGANITVTTALAAWNNYLKDHEVPIADEIKVQAAYDKYRATQHNLLVFASALSTNNASVNTNQFDIYVTDTSVALNELVSLLIKFGVKL